MVQLGVPCDAIPVDEDVRGAIADLAGLADAPEVAAAIDDPCLALLQVMIAQVESQLAGAFTQELASATGLPAFPVDGFSITPDPRSRRRPSSATRRRPRSSTRGWPGPTAR